ncbi:MAG: adenylyl-sulfate kinase [Candidatus Bathyarchaeia archaeon]
MCQNTNGWCAWITGLPGSGKSTIANYLIEKLNKNNIKVQLLSIDSLRKVATPKPSYTDEEREIVYGILVFIAKILTENGINVVIDATGNLRKFRDNARINIEKFIEVYVKCPLEICIERESKRVKTFGAPKNIYKKALSKESLTVPGLGAPYEEPLNPEVIVESNRLSPNECAEIIFKAIIERFK